MVTSPSHVLATAALLLIALVCSSSAAFAQITMRGYVDLHTAGPVILAGDREFITAASTNETESNLPFYTCNGDPAGCAPGTTFSIGAVMSPSGTAAIDGYSTTIGGQTGGSLVIQIQGSVALPALAPTAVVTTSFTATGSFNHPTSGGASTTESLTGSGLADVYLSSPAAVGFNSSWHVDRIVYRFDQAPIPGTWAYNDIGSVGIAGGSHFSNGDFILIGSGGDIWGTADALHFLYKGVENDGSLSAHVMSLSASQPFAKAGVMLRQSGDPASAHVLLDVKPDGGIEFMTRSATGGTTTFIAGATSSFPVWLRLSQTPTAIVGSISSDGITWSTVGSAAIKGCCWSLGGLVVTSHDNASRAQATFEEPQVGLDWPWDDRDIGAVGLAGNAEFVHLAYNVTGSGADIWGAADSFHFLNQVHLGDWRVIARVDGEQDTNPFAKAGVMLRRQLSPDSPNVILDVRPNGAVEFMARDSTGLTNYLGGTTRAFPVWLRLERSGSTVTASTSADGSAWAKVGAIDVTGILDEWAYYGVAVTSHDTSLLNTAHIGTIAVEPASNSGTPPPTAPPNIVIFASDIPSSAMHGVFATAPDSTAASGTKLTTPAGSPSSASAPLASPADYVDIPFMTATNTPYTLWIRVRATNNSKYSDSLWVQFSDAQAGGAGVYPIGTTSGLLVNLATDGVASSLQNWGWVDGAYWMTQPATFTFSTTTHTLRIQPREYGVEIDQIVLSPSTYLNPNASCPNSCGFAPGPVSNDATIVPKP